MYCIGYIYICMYVHMYLCIYMYACYILCISNKYIYTYCKVKLQCNTVFDILTQLRYINNTTCTVKHFDLCCSFVLWKAANLISFSTAFIKKSLLYTPLIGQKRTMFDCYTSIIKGNSPNNSLWFGNIIYNMSASPCTIV